MTEHHDNRPQEDDERLNRAIANAWSDVKMSDELLSSTMSVIRAARDAQSNAEEKREAAVVPVDPIEPADSGASVAKMRPFYRHALAKGLVAAALCLAFVGTGGTVLYHTETAYASIQAQASITLGVNRFGQIISVTSSDGTLPDSIDALGLVGRSYEDGLTALADSGILGDQVDVSVGSNDGSQQQSLQTASTDSLSKAGCSGTCNGKKYGRMGGGSADSPDSDQQGSGQSGQGMGMMGQGQSQGQNSVSNSGSGNAADGNGTDNGSGGNGTGNGNGNRWGAAK